MLFCNVKHSLKANKMTDFQFVMAILVFVLLSNSSLLNNIVGIFQNGTLNFLSIERFLTDILNIGRVLTESSCLLIGLEFLFIQLALVVAIAFVLFMSFNWSYTKRDTNKDVKQEKELNIVEFATNDIYLQTNELIC